MLTFKNQAFFFNRLNDYDISFFKKAVESLPKDLKELNFSLGDRTQPAVWDEYKSGECADFFFQILPSFKHLEKVHFNLKGLGFYNPAVHSHFESELKHPNSEVYSARDDIHVLHWFGATYWYNSCNDSRLVFRICKALHHIRNFGHQRPNIEYSLELMNLTFRCEKNNNYFFNEKLGCFPKETPNFSKVVRDFFVQHPS